MTDSERDNLLLAQGYALRDMQYRIERLTHDLHVIKERLLILDAALFVNERDE